MAAPTQTGVELIIGFGGMEYAGYIPEDWSESRDADEEVIKDVDGATMTILTFDARTLASGTFIIKSTGDVEAPDKNSIISFKGPNDVAAVNRRVQSGSVARNKGVAKLSVSLIREDSMAATYDA